MEESSAIESFGRLLQSAELEREPAEAARFLLGKTLLRRQRGELLAGRIVEVEAYLGPHAARPDPAAHAFRGQTARNAVLFGPAGRAYVYAIYGRYSCMNVSCEPEGRAGCVLLRSLEPLAGLDRMAANRGLAPEAVRRPERLTSGPGRLCQALGLSRAAHNGAELTHPTGELQLREDGFVVGEIRATPRIGIRMAADWPLRFTLAGNRFLSGPKRL